MEHKITFSLEEVIGRSCEGNIPNIWIITRHMGEIKNEKVKNAVYFEFDVCLNS